MAVHNTPLQESRPENTSISLEHLELLKTHNKLLETSHELLKANNVLLKALLDSQSDQTRPEPAFLTSHSSPRTPWLKRKRAEPSSPSTCGTGSSDLSRTSNSIRSLDTTPCSARDQRDGSVSSKRIRVSSTPTISPNSTKYYCGICEAMRKQTPISHMHKHLLEKCPSLHRHTKTSANAEDSIITDPELLLLGCGYCGPTGSSKTFYGDAFLGATRLAQHVVDTHCPEQPGSALVWNTNNATNNVLTHRVFKEQYDGLRQQRYNHLAAAALSWQLDDDTMDRLYNLEKVGGRLVNADDHSASILMPSASKSMVKMLEAAYAPVCETSVSVNQSFEPSDLSSFYADPSDPFVDLQGGLFQKDLPSRALAAHATPGTFGATYHLDTDTS